MNRLWVRLSLMMGGVVFLVFFIQFLSIVIEDEHRVPPAIAQNGEPISQFDEAPPDEITRRLFLWMVFSVGVGLAGGVIISRVISAPVSDLVKAAQNISQGKLGIRVPTRGSREIIELTETFNKMAADLQRSETLRNNLMADVSHELRTPLTVLEGNLRAAMDHVYTLDEAEIANLYGQTRHLIRLVNDLREIALAETNQLPLEKQPTDLNALLTETCQALEPLATEKEVRFVDKTPDLPEISVDPARLRQVFFNLLYNALRHTPAGGEIIVSGALQDHEIQLGFTDNGDGLEPEQLAMVFERFYRGDRSRSRDTGGTGLGLAIVKAIITSHGGRVEAFSKGKGLGCTFRFALPLT
jgi:signal transduction histidine kinase